MNDKLQLAIVIALIVVAVLYFVRHIYLLTKRKPKCGSCPVSGSCAACSGRHRSHDDHHRPPCCH